MGVGEGEDYDGGAVVDVVCGGLAAELTGKAAVEHGEGVGGVGGGGGNGEVGV